MMIIKRINLLVVCLIGMMIFSACGLSSPAATPTPTPTPTPSRKDISVTIDGSGDYPMLEQAVTAAEPGATITLGPGTYRLVYGLKIDKSITLVGAGMDKTEVVSGAPDHVIKFVGRGTFTAKKMTFRHDGNVMGDVVVVEGGKADFSQCRFTGAIYEEGKGNRAGLRYRGSSRGTVQGCVFSGNDNSGILMENQASPTLDGNTCSDNTMVGIGYMGRAGGTARGNKCSGNSIGIGVAVEAKPTLEGNICNENDYGIAYWENAGGQSYNNECSRNKKVGIIVRGSADPELSDNNCRDNAEEDIRDMRE